MSVSVHVSCCSVSRMIVQWVLLFPASCVVVRDKQDYHSYLFLGFKQLWQTTSFIRQTTSFHNWFSRTCGYCLDNGYCEESQVETLSSLQLQQEYHLVVSHYPLMTRSSGNKSLPWSLYLKNIGTMFRGEYPWRLHLSRVVARRYKTQECLMCLKSCTGWHSYHVSTLVELRRWECATIQGNLIAAAPMCHR